ncbi:MAG: glycoside hydrolase family 2 [Tannerellaceae bacterium]|jgi:hypothetical protein|nr:glycoside hydrolase family 2 [Tannerellaceae bacterium]
MKNIFILITSVMLWSGCSSADFTAIEQGFVAPPDSINISVYWYWVNDHLSKEAVVKDLQAMKQVGINRAFIGSNIVSDEKNFGPVKVLSDEWYEAVHTALKTATELGIDIGIFNSPGWSQSGGPWVQPGQAMRYLASSETKVQGPAKIRQLLPQPTERFQDVKVIAWPVATAYRHNLLKSAGQHVLPEGESSIVATLPAAASARSLSIYPSGSLSATVELQAKEGTAYRTVKQFQVDRTNLNLNVGFEPYAPVTVSFPEVEAQEYRILFHGAKAGGSIKSIVLSATPVVERYAEKSLAKMFPSPLPYWHDYLWDRPAELQGVAVAEPHQVLDISSCMDKDGLLSWDVPEGEWIVMRTGMSPTGVTNAPASPEGTGLEVDKMSKAHVAAHFDAFLGKLIERIPAEDRKSWKVVVEDSYETGGQNFTDGFLEEFSERYGYDAVPFLPVFKGHVIGSPDLSDRFLWDVRRMVADKVSYDYVGGLREVSQRHGLTTWLENYGHWGFPGEFLQYGGQSDEIGGEFWSEGNLGDIENRAASSCAHIYGKIRVSAESFTCGGNAYSRYPALMKRRGDWSFTEGVNNTLLHVYIHQPYEDLHPGLDAWFGNEFNRKNTWFSQLDLFVLYLKRCNFMLQQGLNVADVAYFIGEDAPKMTGIRQPELPKGYSYDYINAEVILRDLSVKDGRLVLPHGTSYRMLVLPPLETMRPEVLQKIEQLVAAGAVVLGAPPVRSPSMKGYPEADEEVRTLGEKMWGDLSVKQRAYGKGLIVNDMTMEEVLALLNIPPDFQIVASNDPILYNHRTLDGKEIYFVSNQSEKPVSIRVQFRVKGLQPELWDAVTGAIRPLPAFEQNGETTTVPLELDAIGSAFIVFKEKGRPASADIAANFPEPASIAVDTPWEVRFEADAIKRGPSETVTLTNLKDWTLSDDARIRYYSGTAVYTTNITLDDDLPKGKKWVLDLGKVTAMAKVKINGQYAGGAWTAPYRVEVTPYLQAGANRIEVEVVNTWKNRLIGDQALPAEQQLRPDHSEWHADSPLQPSGLTGPVQLLGF